VAGLSSVGSLGSNSNEQLNSNPTSLNSFGFEETKEQEEV